MRQFADAFRGRRVLVTGHTGFKGSWLALWLSQLGARVSGIALDPSTTPSHWDLLGLRLDDHRVDIRDATALADVVRRCEPEVVFHLAAQPLVRRSYREPLATWSANVMGTANLLEALRSVASLRAAVIVTTDKCYENRNWEWGYREIDRLGGHDPYSASKAGAELVVASYRDAFFEGPRAPLIASARAGNVIGGGDWSEDRLIPDVVRSMVAGSPLVIRSPGATRPWQHVLESLSGYLLLARRLLDGERACAGAWNFGPDDSGNRKVVDVLEGLRRSWPALRWEVASEPQPHEAALLHLDSSRARSKLEWRPIWSLDEALDATARWYRSCIERSRVESEQQLARFVEDAAAARAAWCAP